MSNQEKTDLENTQQSWVCSEGCKMTHKPCEHLERLIPQMRDGDHPQYLASDEIAQCTMTIFQSQFPTFDLKQFKDKIRSYGFTDKWDLDLLTSKYFYGMSNRRIESELGYISRETVRRRLKKLHDLLEERGYKLETDNE